jgi:hypothetical protein
MSEEQSKRAESEDVSRVDHLLGLLRDFSQGTPPSPALRERLAVLASQRLKENSEYAGRGKDRKLLVWLRPALAAPVVLAIGIATVLTIHFREPELVPADKTAKVSRPVTSPENALQAARASHSLISKRPKIYRSRPGPAVPASTRQMTMRLPYSNSAIETGTNTTIQISMFQSELLSLGFPVNATVPDRRIVAELTLGDDGLPSAISVPLPLQVMKEKK